MNSHEETTTITVSKAVSRRLSELRLMAPGLREKGDVVDWLIEIYDKQKSAPTKLKPQPLPWLAIVLTMFLTSMFWMIVLKR